MGEYAIRNSDGQEIKIGTCESMYYLRFEDRFKVSGIPGREDGNVKPWIDEEAAQIRFRLPFPDEDNLLPGEYKQHDRGERLWKKVGEGRFETCEGFSDPTTADDPGTVQLTHPCGLLLNVPCYHGEKLPESSKDIKAHWNGKSWFLELYQLRPVLVDGLLQIFPVVHCRFCRQAWRYKWSDVIDYLHGEMKDRLAGYAKAGMERELEDISR
jgi:hypothetical protein